MFGKFCFTEHEETAIFLPWLGREAAGRNE